MKKALIVVVVAILVFVSAVAIALLGTGNKNKLEISPQQLEVYISGGEVVIVATERIEDGEIRQSEWRTAKLDAEAKSLISAESVQGVTVLIDPENESQVSEGAPDGFDVAEHLRNPEGVKLALLGHRIDGAVLSNPVVKALTLNECDVVNMEAEFVEDLRMIGTRVKDFHGMLHDADVKYILIDIYGKCNASDARREGYYPESLEQIADAPSLKRITFIVYYDEWLSEHSDAAEVLSRIGEKFPSYFDSDISMLANPIVRREMVFTEENTDELELAEVFLPYSKEEIEELLAGGAVSLCVILRDSMHP